MVAQITKNCPACGNAFDTLDKRKVYCSNGCKQDAFRTRHGVSVPTFLQPKSHIKTVPKTRVVKKRVPNPVHQQFSGQIKSLESQLKGYPSHRQNLADKEAQILTQDDELLVNLITGALAAGILVGVTAVGASLSKKAKDKAEKDRILMITLLVALATAGLIAAMSHSEIKNKRQQRKLKKLQNLKQEMEQIDMKVNAATSELAVLRAQQMGIPEYFDQSEEINYQKQQLDASERLATLDELERQRYETISLSHEFSNLFGEPAKGFAMAVHGGSGQGKSTFTVNLAKDLASNNNRVLFVSAEEGLSKSLQTKFKGYKSDLLLISDSRNITGIKDSLKRSHFDIIVLDSIQQLSIKPQQLTALRAQYPKTSFIYILHATKSGTFKGDNSYSHDADIIIKLESYKAIKEKSRYA